MKGWGSDSRRGGVREDMVDRTNGSGGVVCRCVGWVCAWCDWRVSAHRVGCDVNACGEWGAGRHDDGEHSLIECVVDRREGHDSEGGMQDGAYGSRHVSRTMWWSGRGGGED